MREMHGEVFTGAERFLNSATYGLPSQRQTQALHDGLDDWSAGTMDASVFDESVRASRQAFASLVGVSSSAVTIGSAASGLVGLVAASVPDGSRVAVQRGEFTSVTAPFAVQSDRGVEVHQVEPGELEDRAHAFDLVAVSVVQSSDGRVLDLERLRATVAGTGTRVLLDVTQAAGWKHLDLAWADAVVAAGYKWLLSPRGTAWMALSDAFAATLTPHAAGWYSSETPWTNTYAHPPKLAADARRFDLSPAWHPMLGAGIALPWLADLDMHAIERHCTELADRVREAAGLEPAGSAIVALDIPGLADELSREGIRAAQRAGRVRVGFHLYNTTQDADALIAALRRVR